MFSSIVDNTVLTRLYVASSYYFCFKFFLFYVCGYFVFMYGYVSGMCPVPMGPVELEIQLTVSCHVGAGA